MDRQGQRDITLKYLTRDYGYFVTNNRGYATVITLLDSYHTTAVVYDKSYTQTFKNLEDAHNHLERLFNHPPKDILIDRRAKCPCSRIYRWFYRFIQ